MSGQTRVGVGEPIVDFPGRELTGRHVFLITAMAFAVIIGVNVILAWKAVSTFPGIEVRNGYVASQQFQAERDAQQALGWDLRIRFSADSIRLEFDGSDGTPARVAAVEAELGRATNASEDRFVVFRRTGEATFEAPVELDGGRWVMHLTATAEDGTVFRQRVALWAGS